MDIKKIIREGLPESVEIDETTLEAIAKRLSTAQGREFVPKEDYSKKVRRIEELENQVEQQQSATLEEQNYQEQLEILKVKYEEDIASKQQELDEYISAAENGKQTQAKKTILRRQLEAEGANPKLLDLLEMKFDLEKIELDGEQIKDWESTLAPVKEQYQEVFGTVRKQPADVATPPSNRLVSYTLEDIKRMSPKQVNENWQKIKETLKQKG